MGTAAATHNVVLVRDFERSLAFYRDILGLAVTFRQHEYVEFDGRIALCSVAYHREMFPGAVPAGVAREDRPAGNSVVLVRVDDVDAWTRRLGALRVPMLSEPADYPWGERFAFVADPEGNPVGLYQKVTQG